MSTRVSEDRWKKAQKWELEHWFKVSGYSSGRGVRIYLRNISRCMKLKFKYILQREWGDDWNYWWAEKFDNYVYLPAVFDHAIELGCGPYTNMRIILRGRKIRYLYCSDPLTLEYTKIPCWLRNAYRQGKVLLDNHPAEECVFKDGLFDLVVMINVLDHVRDARKCLEEAIRITKSGGFFLLGQDLTSLADIPYGLDTDIGHPIRITHELLDEVLSPQFDIVLRKILPREQGRNPAVHYGTYIYIGKKKNFKIELMM